MGGTSNLGTVMTLANSIIGVSVLAMPFCFKQCGILLSVLMLILSSMVSRLACHFLLKAAQMARRRNFEFLAFHAFGPMGKFLVELCIIGFLMGTCVAFFVVMGDLGPVIIAKTLNIGDSTALRPSVLIGVCLFVVIPLGLLRNVDSLSSISTASVVFYICFVLKVVVESLPHLLVGDWMENVHYWKPSGVLQCIPIFSMALFCQTQLFEIYESIPNASLEQMNELIRKAVNICTSVYISVGFFGYVAFCTQNFSGNVLLSFSPSLISDVIKLGFVMSIAVSFPLTIFPCRASIYSLLFRRVQMLHHDGVSSHIPEARFKCITLFVVSFALAVGLLVPSIELVLGLVGSTIGVLICIVFPSVAFIRINTKSSYDRLLAQIVLFVGALILVLGTYATLYASNEAVTQVQILKDPLPNIVQPEAPRVLDVNLEVSKNKPPDTEEEVKKQRAPAESVVPSVAPELVKAVENVQVPGAESKNVRQEPPVPVEPAVMPAQPAETPAQPAVVPAQVTKIPVKEEPTPQPEVKLAVENKVTLEQVIHQDAIKKEEEALAEAGANNRVQEEPNKQQVDLLLKLEEHKEEQKKLLQEQQEILQQLNKHKEDLERSRQRQQQNKTVPVASSPPVHVVANESKPVVPGLSAAGPNTLTGSVPNGQLPVLQDHPAQSRINENKSSAVKPQSIIPLPLAVQNNAKLFNKALQQVAQSQLAKENLSLNAGQEESKIMEPKETEPVTVGKVEPKDVEKAVQRDILSNMGPSHERDKRDTDERLAADDVKNISAEHNERYCDVNPKNTVTEEMASDKLVASQVSVSPKIENRNAPAESTFDNGKDNKVQQNIKVMKNLTEMTGDSKKKHYSNNTTMHKTTGPSKMQKRNNTNVSESIIKMAPYLSVQSFDGNVDLVKDVGKVDGWKQAESLVKPMSRDLKSLVSEHDMKIDLQKQSEALNESLAVNSVAGQELINEKSSNVPRHFEVLEVNNGSDTSKFVTTQNHASNVSIVVPYKVETPVVMTQRHSMSHENIELLVQSEVQVKPMSRDLKSVPSQETIDNLKLSKILLKPVSQHTKMSRDQQFSDAIKPTEEFEAE